VRHNERTGERKRESERETERRRESEKRTCLEAALIRVGLIEVQYRERERESERE